MEPGRRATDVLRKLHARSHAGVGDASRHLGRDTLLESSTSTLHPASAAADANVTSATSNSFFTEYLRSGKLRRLKTVRSDALTAAR